MIKRFLSLVGGFVLILSMSQAAIVVNFVTIGAEGAGPNGGTVFTYDIDISGGTTARAGTDYFVLYDFGPVLSAVFSDPAGWELGLAELLGPYPPSQNPIDSGAILNARINRIGSDLSGPDSEDFGDLTIDLESPFPTFLNGTLNVSSQFLNTAGSPVPDGETMDIVVPDAAIPEPGTMGLLGASLLSLSYALRQRNL